MFNDLAVIKVGGNKNEDGEIIHYFDGIIAGKSVVHKAIYMHIVKEFKLYFPLEHCT